MSGQKTKVAEQAPWAWGLPATPPRATAACAASPWTPRVPADIAQAGWRAGAPRGRAPARTLGHVIFAVPELVEQLVRFVAAGSEQAGAPRALHHCLLVNRLWYAVTLAVLRERLYFADARRLRQFAAAAHRGRLAPELVVLHKLTRLEQRDLDRMLQHVCPERLRRLELYVCPRVLPPASYLGRANGLRRLALPGNKLVSDDFLIQACAHLPRLQVLDLRACDRVSDAGVVAVATNCPRLHTVNLGRHRNGHLITSVSVVALARHVQLETLGVAGCYINDAGLWELAAVCGPSLARLSLNNCRYLTNRSVPALLALNAFPNLSVLELRNIPHLTDVRAVVRYKQWKQSRGLPVLVEGCDRLTQLFRCEERKLYKENSVSTVQELASWLHGDED
ncbi:AaceriADR061Cp [[Ashbya] aceris (nom. inval.)]|nr:AaceriADR061Cp [[Ashbya] aceris (nom. inval.)]